MSKPFFPIALAAGLFLPVSISVTANAAQLSDGRSAFDHAPLVVRTASSFQEARTPSTYQFTLKVPENAGAPLQAVQIVQDSNSNRVSFDMNRTTAFLGNSFAGGPAVSLANVGGSAPNSNEVMVVFDPPISPGKTVTISLESDRNPDYGGVYFFGVTAFPVGQNSPGVFLGYQRFDVYDNLR